MRWAQRWKTDFILARPEYQVKSTWQAWRAFFSPFRPAPDLVHVRYVRDRDHQYAKPVENLVLAVRGLSAKSYKNAQQHMRRIPLYNSIIQVIREWDIEKMNHELMILQREPRIRTFADFGPLAVCILQPIYKLIRLNPHVHLLPALAKMFESARMYVTNQDERDLLQRYYSIARDELPQVFSQVRVHLYPVLLKILAHRYEEPDGFFIDHEAEILAFLGLRDEDLLLDRPEAEVPADAQPVPPPRWTPTEERVPHLAREGLDLLDELFPKAGWRSLGASPDFFSYFQTIFEYPKGSDLIPVDDPIQVIQPLSEVLQHLFYGFQNVQWGTTRAANGDMIPLQEVLDKAIARWHFFHEEFFGKNYLPLLMEYCREIERSGPLSTEAKRHEHQLLWFQRNYLLPNLVLPIMDDVRVKNLGYPNLPHQVREMIELLAPIAVDIERNGNRSTALRNPENRVRFPVSSMVSQRFQAILKHTDVGDQANNRTLLFYTLALLSTLDDLLSRPGSQLYQRKPKHFYRTAGDDKPVYNAPRKNSVALLKKLNEQSLNEIPTSTGRSFRPGTFYGPFMAAEEIKSRIAEFQNDKRPFSVITFRTWVETREEEFETLLDPPPENSPPLHRQDDGTWIGVMPDAGSAEAESFARRVLDLAAEHQPAIPLGALVLPFAPHWTLEKLLAAPEKGWAAAAAVPPQALGVWSPSLQGFEFRADVPMVTLRTAEPEPSDGPLTDQLL